jgi:CBS domain-containing protein
MQAREIMSDGVMSVAASATVYEAAKLLVNSRVSAMPVVDDNGVMVGILSEADIIKGPLMAAKQVGTETLGRPDDDAHVDAAISQAKAQRVSDVMTRGVIAAHETASLREIADLMLKHRIKRVPIMRDQAIVGIVSRVDLLKALISVGPRVYAPQPPATDDQQLRGTVVAALRGHNWSVAQWFDAVVSGGVVHLWGVVPSDAVRQTYVDAARQVPGVEAVENHMHVGRAAARRA